MTVAPRRLPGRTGERSVASTTVEQGGLRSIEPDTAVTEERQVWLSKPLSGVD
ncbi:MAG: hypothetical protein J07HX64_01981 [halophilic archaeon J07HX64]|nr:MAG: hypothetical protein J07HX64_01981 [halophilic archaeon J07HX64]